MGNCQRLVQERIGQPGLMKQAPGSGRKDGNLAPDEFVFRRLIDCKG